MFEWLYIYIKSLKINRIILILLVYFLCFSKNVICNENCVNSPQVNSKFPINSWHNCLGMIVNNNYGKYIGLFMNGFPNGKGEIIFDTDLSMGNKYVGQFKNGKPEGKGTYYHNIGNKAGDIYIGEFKNGKPEGTGKYFYLANNPFSGDKYTGGWLNGEKNGYGTYTRSNGNIYIGEFTDGQANGNGTLFWNDGRIWRGFWKNWIWVGGLKWRNKNSDYLAGWKRLLDEAEKNAISNKELNKSD